MGNRLINDFKYSMLMFLVVIILVLIGIFRVEHYSAIKKALLICWRFTENGSEEVIGYWYKLFL